MLALAAMSAVASLHASTFATATVDKQGPATSGPAFFVRHLDNPRERREARADILDTPVLPGSIVKA
ncbi:MAG: hypothetical protein Q8L75_08255, partial [Acidobacteriota bacterium]|nr:hypothetical protein [Acidobacteriota bacterium]